MHQSKKSWNHPIGFTFAEISCASHSHMFNIKQKVGVTLQEATVGDFTIHLTSFNQTMFVKWNFYHFCVFNI